MKGKIFNAQEVQAIIAGNKTMFREVIKPRIKVENYKLDDGSGIGLEILLEECPYQVGQKIFVKEKFARSFDSEGNPIAILEADGEQERKWRPAQHMKQEHSRITLLIKEIRVEKLDQISDKDALKEGVSYEGGCEIPRITFKMDWNATHKKPKEKFEANPFVWVVDFKINN